MSYICSATPFHPFLQQGPREVTIFQAFQHFACLYIKYLQIFRKLELCYDNMVHPQKRIFVRQVLELVIRRVIELKHDLVTWNPPNSYARIPTGHEEAFPWEYVHLDDILVDLKLSPETLEIPIPRYFREDASSQIEQRDKIVKGYMRLKHNTEDIMIEEQFDTSFPEAVMTIERAMEIIQRNERGRQGVLRAQLVRDLRDKERQSRMYEATAQAEMEGDIAATNITRFYRGYRARVAAALERENELVFIAMRPGKDGVEQLLLNQAVAQTKRKQEQAENKEAYLNALIDMKAVIMDEEGPEKREELRDERTLWVTDQIAQEKFPDSLEDYYNMQKNTDSAAEIGGVDKKADKKDKKADKKDKKADKKGKKGKKSAEEPPEMPALQGKTEVTEAMFTMMQKFEETWEERDESENFKQKYDSELAKELVRPNVYEEIRKQVDEMLLMNLQKIRMQIAPTKGGKGKKGKKGKGKKGKKDKGKKKKPLPGEKISELKGLDTDQMLSMLIEAKLVVRCRDRKISDVIGDFNYLGTMHHNMERKDKSRWTAPDPSIAQIRQAVSEYCILPNGAPEIRTGLNPKKNVKSLMLFGPSGSGKTMLVEAVANELGALLIHLSPEKLRGLFPGKSGPTKLVHLVMTVARDPAMQPVVIYIDRCDEFFLGGKKAKADKEGPARFKKDLITYKNNALELDHRVVIIGTTKNPENGDLKDCKNFFDRFLYTPYPDYSSRVLIWKHYIQEQLRAGHKAAAERAAASATANSTISMKQIQLNAAKEAGQAAALVKSVLDRLDFSSLAHISEGYSAGAIAKTVRTIVTTRKVSMIKVRPLNTAELTDNLALQDVTYQDDKNSYLSFIRAVTNLDERRNRIEAMLAEAAAEGKDDKKKKK